MFMKRSVFAAAAVACLLAGNAIAGSYLRIVSWNLRHEGWSGETDYTGDANQIWKQYGSSSKSTNGCDLVILQEVMYSSAASGIASALTSVSGVNWTYAVTPAIGRTSYKECYAVCYRTDNVSLLSSTVYSDSGDKFEREPQIVKVKDNRTNEDFTFINWHTTWSTSANRQAEIAAIPAVFNSVQNGSSTDEDVILIGDNNADGNSSWFDSLKSTSVISPAVTNKVNIATTINSSGSYVSAYDHAWMQASYVTEYSSSGRDYVSSPKNLYNGLSDHAPIWVKFYSSSSTD
jgi:endonuclease/exonuclease/phosphatase family metal-dependent hydrolase